MVGHLPLGSRLEQYEIRGVFRSDDVSVEYEAVNRSTGRAVTVIEFFPDGLAVRSRGTEVAAKNQAEQALFDAGLVRFLALYRTLVRLDHPAIVNVIECLQFNRTGYVVIERPAGETLAARLQGGRTLSTSELSALLRSMIDGLESVHRANLLHRDINPENIVIRSDGTPVLIGFSAVPRAAGGSRQAFSPNAPAVSSNPTAGYGALEQYSHRGQEGPWTDIYALGAVLYRCVTGVTPTDAPGRAIQDDLIPAARAAQGSFGSRLLGGIDAALALRVGDRPRSISAWRVSLAEARETAESRVGPRGSMAARRTARARQVAESEQVRPNWVFPAVAATAFIALLTWVDTGILRSTDGRSTHGAEAQPEEFVPSERELEVASPSGAGSTPNERKGSTVEIVPRPDSAPGALSDSVTKEDVGSQADIAAAPDPRNVDTPEESAGTPEQAMDGTADVRSAVSDPVAAVEARDASGNEKTSDESTGAQVQEAPVPIPDDTPQRTEPESIVAVVEPQPVEPPAVPVNAGEETGTEPGSGDQIAIANTQDSVSDGNTVSQSVDTEASDSTEPDIARELLPFTVNTVPPGAAIRFADGSRQYLPGMVLAPGEYRIVAELPGFTDWEGTLIHGPASGSHQVNLATLPTEFSDSLSSGGEGPVMVRVSLGSFQMGCVSGSRCFSNEFPVLEVSVERGFAMSKHEITTADFDRFVAGTGHRRFETLNRREGASHPVVNVNWADAMAYTEWLSAETGHPYRLPTETEWEYAARAGSAAAYSWGNELLQGGGNCAGCSNVRGDGGTTPAGSFAANAWGLHDMHGNVWEWVLDCPRPFRVALKPGVNHVASADCNRRIRRGGSWAHSPRRMRAASRDITVATLRSPNTGFRVLRVNP